MVSSNPTPSLYLPTLLFANEHTDNFKDVNVGVIKADSIGINIICVQSTKIMALRLF